MNSVAPHSFQALRALILRTGRETEQLADTRDRDDIPVEKHGPHATRVYLPVHGQTWATGSVGTR